MSSRRRGGRGLLRRTCDVCRRKYLYCSKLVWELELKNRRDADTVELYPEGSTVCHVCVEHNGIELKVKDLEPAKSRVQCHRCGGQRRVPRRVPTTARVPASRRHLANTEPCPKCDGEGTVAA